MGAVRAARILMATVLIWAGSVYLTDWMVHPTVGDHLYLHAAIRMFGVAGVTGAIAPSRSILPGCVPVAIAALYGLWLRLFAPGHPEGIDVNVVTWMDTLVLGAGVMGAWIGVRLRRYLGSKMRGDLQLDGSDNGGINCES